MIRAISADQCQRYHFQVLLQRLNSLDAILRLSVLGIGLHWKKNLAELGEKMLFKLSAESS